jgi:hypothetical protein
MRKFAIFLVLLLSLFLYGCTTTQTNPTPAISASGTPTISIAATQIPNPTAAPSQQLDCKKPDWKFGAVTFPPEITYSNIFPMEVQLLFSSNPCKPENMTASVELFEGKKFIASQNVTGGKLQEDLRFSYTPDRTKEYQFFLKIQTSSEEENDENNEYLANFTVKPLGFYDDLSGENGFTITQDNTRAQAFYLDSPTTINRISLYLKRQDANLRLGKIYVQIRPNAANAPASTEEIGFESGFEVLPTSYDWIVFTPSSKTTLSKGVHWLVVNTNDARPGILLHYSKNSTYMKPEYSLRSDRSFGRPEKWEQHADGVFDFKLSNVE